MRRLLPILMVVLTALPAQAGKLLVVDRSAKVTLSQGTADAEYNRTRSASMFARLLDLLGISYVWPANTQGLKTEWLRTGIVPSSPGSATADTFSAVVVWNFVSTNTSTGNQEPNCRIDSLLASVRPARDSLVTGGYGVLKVPLMLTGTNYWTISIGGPTIQFASTSSDTTGVTAGIPGQKLGGGRWHPKGDTTGFYAGSYWSGWPMSAYEPNGGRRIRLVANSSNRDVVSSPSACTACIDCDSMTVGLGADTVGVWQLLRSHIAGSKGVVVAEFAGGGGQYDSATGSSFSECENEPLAMIYAVAVLDSMTGHALITKPIKFGLTIDGAGHHESRVSFNGTFLPDSDTIKTNILRLASLHIPAVLGWQPSADTAAVYPYERAWWTPWKELRYSPQSWVMDSAATVVSGRASKTLLVDLLGHYRKRAAYGPGSGAAGDTSASALLVYARQTMQAAGLPLSTTLLPPWDDVLPANSGQQQDSVLYGFARAGFTTVRIHGRSANGTAAFGGPNPLLRQDDTQGVQWAFGYPMKVLAHNGFSQLGGTANAAYELAINGIYFITPLRDTVCSALKPGTSDYASYNIYDDTWRIDSGLLPTVAQRDYGWTEFLTTGHGYTVGKKIPMDDYQRPFANRASLIRLCVNDLGGEPNGPPPSNGWWFIKSVDSWIRLVNQADGKTVVAWDYPENITP